MIFKAVSFFGDVIAVYGASTLLICFYLMSKRYFRKTVLVFSTLALLPLSLIMQDIIRLPRPAPSFTQAINQTSIYGFPSGHTLYYTVFFGFLLYLASILHGEPRWLRWVVGVISGLFLISIGPSRIFLGVHYLRDVLGGHVLGLAILLLLIALDRKINYPVPENQK